MTRSFRRLCLPMLASLAAAGCAWIHPTEPRRDAPDGLAQPRFEDQPYEGGWLLLRNEGGFRFASKLKAKSRSVPTAT